MGEQSNFGRQRVASWGNNARRLAAKAARRAAPPPPRPPSSAEMAEQRAVWHEQQDMPLSATAIREAVEDQPDLYPRGEERP